MRHHRFVHLAASLALGIGACLSAAAQEASAASTESFVPSRVVERIDDTRLVTLTGNTHPMARPSFDKGPVDPQLSLERMQLLLKRSPEQEKALEAFMAEQYDSKSPNFHHWLQPEEFGALYGPSDSDIAAVTGWLQNHGFQIYQVNKGRVTIEFSGTADQVRQAFHTEIHNYLVNGKAHIANSADPQIPEALAPVVGGIASLHNFFPVHQSILGRYVRRDKTTGRVTPAEAEFSGPTPQYGFTNENGNPQEDITPYDFATIYNLLPLWNAGITGKGQTIAISAVTDINASDVNTFRSTFGLGGFTGTINQIHNGTDPGIVQGALVENTLDTEWSGAAAPDATVDVVITASTATTFGGELSDQYIAEHPSMFTIMSASYGECEIELGTTGNQTINAIYQQGAAAGISIFESSGDQGSTGCDNSDAQTRPNPAVNGLNVNGDASSPWVTAVGGTEFTWQDYRTTYWSATNSGTNLSNALGYIPESPWNGTCTSQVLLDRLWQPFYGLTTLEQVCNYTAENYDQFVTVTGGSGGVSSCITSDGSTFASCGGGYAQPSWQKGITGMPGTQYRYVPDVSLFASSGFPYGENGSAYLICVASNSPEKSCNYSENTQVIYQEVGGTSVSSPALAGIMALVQQKQNGAAQGLANPVFYSLFSKENLANCNSSTVANGNSCIFYDVTYGNNAQVCPTGDRNCVTSTSGDTYGVVSGYTTTTGYDQATGLGSVNATNLVNNWPSSSTAPAVTLSPTSLTFASTTVGSTSAAQVVTVKNTGTAALTLTSETLTGTNASSYLISAKTCTSSLAAGASCTVSIEFKPAATGALTASLSVADNASGSPQTVALSGTGAAAATFTVSLSPTSLTFPSTAVGSTSAAQAVTVKNTGTGTVTLTSETITGTNASSFLKSATTCGSSLTAGASCTVSVEFKPAAAGSSAASLSIADNASGSPQLVSLSGTSGSGAVFSFSPTSLTFPATNLNATSVAQTVTITNTGAAAATVSSYAFTGTNAAEFLLAGKTCGSSLAAGASCTLSIEFKPTTAGAASASLVATDSAAGSPQSVPLSGTGASQPTIAFSPTSLTFPATNLNATSAAQVLTVSNTSAAPITVSSYAFSGTNAGEFAIAGKTCGSSLAANSSCTLSITFKPTAAGAATAKLVATDNAAGSPQSVNLSGTGASQPTIAFSPTSLTFPSTNLNATSAAQVLTISNSTAVPVTVSSYAFSGTNAGEFAIAGKTCGSSLAANSSCTLSITFKPTTAGAATAKLVATDSAAGSPQSVPLSGTGASQPTVTFSPTSLTFPATKTGTSSAAQVLTIKNTSAAPMTVSSYAFSGTSAGEFSIASKTCGSSLAANSSCTLSIVFKPTATGSASAKLVATDSAVGSPQSVPLAGTAD